MAIRMRRIGWGALAWIGILFAIGIVQIVRAQWFDAAVILGASLLLALEAATRAPGRGTGRSLKLVAVPLIALATVAAVAPRQSLLVQLAVCLAGVVAVVYAWPQREPSRAGWSSGQRRLALVWAAIAVLGCLWELGQFIAGRMHPDRPAYALSDLIDPLLAGAVGQAVFAAVWIALGIFLVSRGRA